MSRTWHHVPMKLFASILGSMVLVSCVSHLQEAKSSYAEAQRLARAYQTEKALKAFSETRKEAGIETQRHPSAQAFMLKGMAELGLESWEDAEESFREAFAYGFEKGEEWAEHVSLFGMALSLQEMGFDESSARIYDYLLQRAKLRPVVILAAQRFADLSLERALQHKGKDRQRALDRLLNKVERLSEKELSCGFYHYLLSQILSHIADYHRSFEEAVWARELGLPSEKILRDNDNQIVHCYQELKERLASEGWEEFQALYMRWVKKWDWLDPVTPAWKKR